MPSPTAVHNKNSNYFCSNYLPKPIGKEARMKKTAFLALAWLLLPAAGQAASKLEIPKISSFQLNNGMRFIVMERHQAPVATFFTYADVGGNQEITGKTGLAHMFEHMAFKGTPSVGTKNYAQEKIALAAVDRAFLALRSERLKGEKADPKQLQALEKDFKDAEAKAQQYVIQNQFGRIVEQAGGRNLNASTGTDRTVYHFSLPVNEQELWFYLESERFLHPVLREFYKERDVVMQERRMRTESDPLGTLLEDTLAEAYKAHPYGRPVIGYMSDLQYIARPDAEAFFQDYYGPSDLIGVVVGDVQPADIQQLATKYFGRIPGRPKPGPLHTVEPPQDGERRVRLTLQSQPVIMVAFHKPAITHPDNEVYEVLSSLLSEGRSSHLYRSLVRDRKLAVEAAGFTNFPGEKYPNLFVFYALAAPGHTNAEIEQALEDEIQRLVQEPVSQEELEGVKRRSRANLLRLLDDPIQMAEMLASMQALTGDWQNLFRQLDKIDAVTATDVQRVARTTFTVNNRTVTTIETADTAPTPGRK
jgi:predicted Zn-dependent peptidase